MAEPVVVSGGGEGRSRRVLMLAGGAAALLLMLVVLPGVLFGGGDGGADDFSFGPTPARGPTTSVPPEERPEETFEGFTSKNPFTPLVAAETPAAVAEGPAPPTVTIAPGEEITFPEDGAAADPGTDPGTELGGNDEPAGDGDPPEGGDTTTTTAPPGPPARQPDRVSLLEVFRDPGGQLVASMRVNDTTHQVAEGDEFATSYRVLDLDGTTRCGQFLFGDDRFGLCEGDETLK